MIRKGNHRPPQPTDDVPLDFFTDYVMTLDPFALIEQAAERAARDDERAIWEDR